MPSNSRIKARCPGPRAPKKHETKKTRVGGDSHNPQSHNAAALSVFCSKKRRFSHALKLRNRTPRSEAQGPDSRAQGPGSMGPVPKPQASVPRAQAPNSKIECPLPGLAEAGRGYQNPSGSAARSAERFFVALAAKQDTKLKSPRTHTFKQQLMSSFELYVLRAAPSDFLLSPIPPIQR